MERLMGSKIKTIIVSLIFVLFSITLIGLFWLSSTPGTTITLALAYAAGLSMIFLPCTLPLVFIIVPLSMGAGYKKGLYMAVLFGLGLTITITAYGIAIAFAGKLLGLDQATRIMLIVAGLAAYVFGLVETGILKFRIPSVGGMVPSWIAKRKDYAKSFFMGLFLGNAGIGCPNPAFYALLAYIASLGSIADGAYLGFVHGIGRATPLIMIALLAIVGVNTTKWIVEKKESVSKAMGWVLVLVGAFILLNGVYGHEFYEGTTFHTGLNELWAKAGGGNLAESEQVFSFETETKGFNVLMPFLGRMPTMQELQFYGMLTFYALLAMPVLVYFGKKWQSMKKGVKK